MVVFLSRETREVVHDDEVNLALVCAAVLQEILQLAAVGRLGALTLLLKALEDFEAVASAVLFAGAKLRRQAESKDNLRLFPAHDRYDFAHGADDCVRRLLRHAVSAVGHEHLAAATGALREPPLKVYPPP